MYVYKKHSNRAHYKGSDQLLDYLVFSVCLCVCVCVCVCACTYVHALGCINEVWLSNKETGLKKYFIIEISTVTHYPLQSNFHWMPYTAPQPPLKSFCETALHKSAIHLM